MYHIVIGVDEESDRARKQAQAVVNLPRAADEVRATVLHVFTRNVEGASVSQFAPARAARDVLEAAGIEVTLAEDSGDPGRQVLDQAERLDADLVSVAGRKRSPAGKAVFGSVSQSVMLDSEIPVLFCPAEPE